MTQIWGPQQTPQRLVLTPSVDGSRGTVTLLSLPDLGPCQTSSASGGIGGSEGCTAPPWCPWGLGGRKAGRG
jgi:hypothetical protein